MGFTGPTRMSTETEASKPEEQAIHTRTHLLPQPKRDIRTLIRAQLREPPQVQFLELLAQAQQQRRPTTDQNI